MLRSILLVFALFVCAHARTVTATQDQPDAYGATAARVFRALALHPADTTRIYLTDAASISENDRAELVRLLDDYTRKVDAEAEQLRTNPPRLSQLVERAQAELATDFQTTLEKWLDAHSNAQTAIERQQAILQIISDGVLDGGGEIVSAAQQAGLPKRAEAQASDIVLIEVHELQTFASALQKRQDAASKAPEMSAVRLDAMTILADNEIFMLQGALRIHQGLCALLPAEQREKFNDALLAGASHGADPQRR